MTSANGTNALAVTDLSAQYGAAHSALTGLSIHVPEGQIVSLLGPNGAGKSTLMRSVSGLIGHHGGSVTTGTVELLGADVTRESAAGRVERGLAQALEGRHVFPELTVEDNLAAGAYIRRYGKAEIAERHEKVLHHFPKLGDLMDRQAGYLSGGEQQMLAIGRALMSNPKVLLLDEPSLGLAPKIVENVRDVILDINSEGTSILLVEQNAAMALSIASYGYLLDGGRVVKEGTAENLRNDDEIVALYLGGATTKGQVANGG